MSLQDTIKQIEKEHGKGSIMSFDNDNTEAVEVISTQSIKLDEALGVGGIPRGRIIEIYGPEASGKTTLCLHLIAECQKQGGKAAFIDAEHALDMGYSKKLGINLKELLFSQPDCGEQALSIVEALVKSGEVQLVVVDSVAALTPRAEIDGEMSDANIGLQARLMSKAMRKLNGIICKTNSTVVFTNQMRSKIGVFFGSPETTSGGNALKFYASVRLDMRRISQVKDKDEVIGNIVKIKVVKNKVASPFKEAIIQLTYGIGFDSTQELLDILVEREIIEKSGAWFRYGEDKFQGMIKAKEYVSEHYEEFLKLIKKEERTSATEHSSL